MIEQRVEMYDISTDNGQTKAKNEMNDNISKGWQIKIMTITPDYGHYSHTYPQIYVLYERQTQNGIVQ